MTRINIRLILVLGLLSLTTACLPSIFSSSSGLGDEDSGNISANKFSIDNCFCAGISEKQKPKNSTASLNTSSLNLHTGVTVDIQRQLTCRWEESYQSDNLTGTINLSLQIYLMDSEEDAAAMYEAARIEIDEDRSYCLEDSEHCSIGTAQFKSERILYTEGTIFIRGGEEVLPSTHIGDLARKYEDISEHYFIRATVNHPELVLGDIWAFDQIQALDRCALSLIEE